MIWFTLLYIMMVIALSGLFWIIKESNNHKKENSMTNKQFEQIEYLSKKLWGDINNGHEYSMVTYTEFLGIVTEVWEKLQEEPVNEDLEEEIDNYVKRNGYDGLDSIEEIKYIANHFTKWQKEHSWKPADGDELPEIGREVVVLIQPYPLENSEYAVSFAHRPNPDGWDGKSLSTGKVEHYIPKTYDKGGWNIPDVKYWLDYDINELLCREK